MRILPLLVILIIGNSFILQGQTLELPFLHLGQKEGLSQGTNPYVFRDSYGSVWISSLEGLNRFDGEQVKVYKSIPGKESTMLGNLGTSQFFEDREHNIWFSNYKGINCYLRSENNFKTFRLKGEDGKLINEGYQAIFLDDNQKLWLQIEGGLWTFEISTYESKYYGEIEGQRFGFVSNSENNIRHIIASMIPNQGGFRIYSLDQKFSSQSFFTEKDEVKLLINNFWIERNEVIWMASNLGLLRFDLDSKTSESFLDSKFGKLANLWSVCSLTDNQLLISCPKGLFIFDKKKKNYISKVISKSKIDGLGPSELFLDRQNNLWISYWGEGLEYTNLDKNKFETLPKTKNESILNISKLKDNAHKWVGTKRSAISYNLKNEDNLKFEYAISNGNRNQLPEVQFFFSTNENENYAIASGKFILQCPKQNEDFQFLQQMPSSIYYLLTLNNNKTLIADYDNLFYLEKQNNQFTRTPIPFEGDFNKNDITYVYEDIQNRLFLSGYSNDLVILEPNGEGYKMTHKIPDVGICKALYEDQNGKTIWGATTSGLMKLDLSTYQFKLLTEKEDNIPNETYYCVLPDKNGNLWMSSNNGIVRYHPEKKAFRRYTELDGVQGKEFNTNAWYQEEDGTIWMGGSNGLNVFKPEEIEDLPYLPQIQFSDLYIADTLFQGEQHIDVSEKLELTYEQNTFSIEFVAIEYSDPENNKTKYRLRGYEENWTEGGPKVRARYPKVAHGDYIFQVLGANSDGVWMEQPRELKVKVLPPFWLTWWFISLCVLAVGVAAYAFYRFQLNRKLAVEEARRLRELDELKTRLYANITHEFRTPLTVILGMNEQLEGNEEKRKLIHRNGSNLLNLINQMLELSKLESGHLKLNLIHNDIVAYLLYLFESFDSFAVTRNIQLKAHSSLEELPMLFDEEKIRHIIANLVSNAIKFTEAGGQIDFNLNQLEVEEKNLLEIKVKDTGKGIPTEMIPKIFDRFYQIDGSSTRKWEGTGIGLALTKELVTLMEGTISVESELGVGSEFKVLLPIIKGEGDFDKIDWSEQSNYEIANIPEANPIPVIAAATQKGEEEELPILLVIEDNADVIEYIKSCLGNSYQIQTAMNGQEGIEKAIEIIPDVIICDVMMPIKDGFEVTRTLKEDERTSHIPIIILTAKSSLEDKIEGLEGGADAYLTKPFHKRELEVRLNKLIELRKQLRERYSDEGFWKNVSPDSKKVLRKEDEFLQKIRKVVEDNMDNSNFEIPDLCKAVHMSHTQVYRKIKALTNKTPSLFIRTMRLHKGMELLLSTDLSVSEVAYDVGFADPNYFSRTFVKEFGKKPSEVRG